MTLDQLTRRDRRFAELEAIPRANRTAAQQDELGRLVAHRDSHWRRLPRMIAATRAKVAEQETYARQIGLPLQIEAA